MGLEESPSRAVMRQGGGGAGWGRSMWCVIPLGFIEMMMMMMMMIQSFITQGGESREDKKRGRKATRSKGRGPEERASRALMRQGGSEGCGAKGSGRSLSD